MRKTRTTDFDRHGYSSLARLAPGPQLLLVPCTRATGSEQQGDFYHIYEIYGCFSHQAQRSISLCQSLSLFTAYMLSLAKGSGWQRARLGRLGSHSPTLGFMRRPSPLRRRRERAKERLEIPHGHLPDCLDAEASEFRQA